MANHVKLLLIAVSALISACDAKEVFVMRDVVTGQTNSTDVEGLTLLQHKFIVLQILSGDPCSPIQWTWVQCSTDATPRITALYLSDYGLIGSLPDFGMMDALEAVDLSNNLLSGPIPKFLGNLPNLQQLNLANNDFSGSIPDSLSNNKKLDLVVTGNSNLCLTGKSCQTTNNQNPSVGTSGSDEPSAGGANADPSVATPGTQITFRTTKKKSNKLAPILGSTIPTLFVFWAIVGFFAIRHHKKKSAAPGAAITPGLQGHTFEVTIDNENADKSDQQAESQEVKMDME